MHDTSILSSTTICSTKYDIQYSLTAEKGRLNYILLKRAWHYEKLGINY